LAGFGLHCKHFNQYIAGIYAACLAMFWIQYNIDCKCFWCIYKGCAILWQNEHWRIGKKCL